MKTVQVHLIIGTTLVDMFLQRFCVGHFERNDLASYGNFLQIKCLKTGVCPGLFSRRIKEVTNHD